MNRPMEKSVEVETLVENPVFFFKQLRMGETCACVCVSERVRERESESESESESERERVKERAWLCVSERERVNGVR